MRIRKCVYYTHNNRLNKMTFCRKFLSLYCLALAVFDRVINVILIEAICASRAQRKRSLIRRKEATHLLITESHLTGTKNHFLIATYPFTFCTPYSLPTCIRLYIVRSCILIHRPSSMESEYCNSFLLQIIIIFYY